LTAAEGQVVQLTLINGEGAEHDIVFPDQNTKSPRVTGKGASTLLAERHARHLAGRAQTLQDARKPMHTDPSTI
jgi:hypothetical protein